jgi:hypothetical protein
MGVILLAVALAQPTPAAAQAQGASCTTSGATAPGTATSGGQNLLCSSGTWQYVPYQFGTSAASCSSATAGMIRWTGTGFQYCNGITWGSFN